MAFQVSGWRRPVLAATAFVAFVLPQAAAAESGPGYAAILVDADTREVLYANGADLPRHPASITKIMTLFLTFDALSSGRLHLTDPVVISRHAASQRPSRLGLAPGKSLSVDDAIRVIAVKSANDIAVALAEKLGGTEENFAQMMTRKARALGMRNTNFVNATGLPDANHITTARDLAILSEALIRTYPRYYTYFSTEKYQYEKLVFANHNHLLGRMPGMDGIKTGYTVDAGFTLAASAVRSGHRMIAVVLGEPTAAARDRDVTALIDTGFAVEAGRAQGQSVSVASLLAPLSHPAIRIALPGIEQGSGDASDGADRAAKPRVERVRAVHLADRHGSRDSRQTRLADRGTDRHGRASHSDRASKSDSHHGKSSETRLAARDHAAKGKHHAETRVAADDHARKGHGKAKVDTVSKTSKHGKAKQALADKRSTHRKHQDG